MRRRGGRRRGVGEGGHFRRSPPALTSLGPARNAIETATGVAPVPYTPLDVYKRQVFNINSIWFMVLLLWLKRVRARGADLPERVGLDGLCFFPARCGRYMPDEPLRYRIHWVALGY